MSSHEEVIQALLRKAAGTDNENEAAAFYAKAEALMVKWSIDDATVRASMAHTDRANAGDPVVVRFPYSAGPSEGYLQLIAGIAKVNGCRTVKMESSTTGMAEVSLVGFQTDIDHVIMLYVSLMTQELPLAQSAYSDLGDRSYGGRRIRWQTFHVSHLQGFASRIVERLTATREEVIRANDATSLMYDREAQVREALHGFFPHLGTHHTTTRSFAGYNAGRTNGDRVDVGNVRVASQRLIGG